MDCAQINKTVEGVPWHC